MKRKRTILHIRAGSDDWDPTIEELTQLIDCFNTCSFGQDVPVNDKIEALINAVATRQGIDVQVLELDSTDPVFTTADPDKMRDVVACRLLSDFLKGTHSVEDASDEFMAGYYEALSQVRNRINEIVAELVK